MRKFNVSFSDELYSDIKAEADKIGITMTAFITISVHEYIKQNRVSLMAVLAQQQMDEHFKKDKK